MTNKGNKSFKFSFKNLRALRRWVFTVFSEI